MKLDDILENKITLRESITFSPATLEKEIRNGKEVKFYSSPSEKKETPCDECKWYESEGRTCPYCNGTKKQIEYVSLVPEVNLSNSNAYFVMDMLGLEKDYGGVVPNEKLGDLKQKLMRWKNSSSRGTKDPSRGGGEAIVRKDSDTGMSRIGKTAQWYDGGRSDDYIENLIDRLYQVIDYSQKNDMHLSWS